jgi:predicted nuclease of restriction endonuclease-like (RecB) superfamily
LVNNLKVWEMKELENINLQLFTEISKLIEESKKRIAVSVNSELSVLYWNIGKKVNGEVLKGKRADYGKQLIILLCKQLQTDYGSSFSEKNVRRMMQFASVFPENEIVVSLVRQLTWTHIIAIIPIEDPLKREFYIEMCKHERWSVRTLRERINSLLYERTAISKRPEETIRKELEQLRNEQQLTPDLVFRDPYVLEFLGLKDTFSEKDLESAIIAELQSFIIELGSDFAFMARQKRITIDNRDYRMDLLFYHRRLKSLIVIELKLGDFEAGYKGQMELYLRWLEKHEMAEGENPPVGLILCTGKNREHIELMQLHLSNIKIAEYLTILPSKELLLEKFHQAVEMVRNRLENQETKN